MENQNMRDSKCPVPGFDALCLQAENAKSGLQQFKQQMETWRKTCITAIYKSVEKHYKVMEAKHGHMVYKDEFGYEHTEDFDKAFVKFANEIVFEREVSPIVQQVIEEYVNCDGLKKARELFSFMKHNSFLMSELERCWPDFKTDLAYLLNPCSIFSMKLVDNSMAVGEVNAGVAHVNMSFRDDDNEAFFVPGLNQADRFLYARNTDDRLLQRCVFDMRANARGLCVSLSWSFFMRLFNFANFIYSALPESEDAADETPLQYEKRIANKLNRLGFEVNTTKASGDQGADILATKNGISFAIQCKKYSSPVGNKAVQEAYAGRAFYGQDYGVVVSNADFTLPARQAAHACGIILLSDNKLEDLLNYTNS